MVISSREQTVFVVCAIVRRSGSCFVVSPSGECRRVEFVTRVIFGTLTTISNFKQIIKAMKNPNHNIKLIAPKGKLITSERSGIAVLAIVMVGAIAAAFLKGGAR